MYDATYKLVIFGDAGCGRTTLTQRFLTNLFVSDSKMTIGVDFSVKDVKVDGKRVKLQIWDFGGEEHFRFLLVKGTNGAMFMYDITNYSSLAHIDDWLLATRKDLTPDTIFPIIVVGGKADLLEDREVTSEDALEIAQSRGTEGFIECSSKSGENVEEAFISLTRLMIKKSNF